jgi:hypothetical protein
MQLLEARLFRVLPKTFGMVLLAQSTGALVEFEYHPNCGGWRIATM